MDETFGSAFGGIVSLVATGVKAAVRLVATGAFKDAYISKVYGDMWKKINDREYEVRMTQLIS